LPPIFFLTNNIAHYPVNYIWISKTPSFFQKNFGFLGLATVKYSNFSKKVKIYRFNKLRIMISLKFSEKLDQFGMNKESDFFMKIAMSDRISRLADKDSTQIIKKIKEHILKRNEAQPYFSENSFSLKYISETIGKIGIYVDTVFQSVKKFDDIAVVDGRSSGKRDEDEENIIELKIETHRNNFLKSEVLIKKLMFRISFTVRHEVEHLYQVYFGIIDKDYEPEHSATEKYYLDSIEIKANAAALAFVSGLIKSEDIISYEEFYTIMKKEYMNLYNELPDLEYVRGKYKEFIFEKTPEIVELIQKFVIHFSDQFLRIAVYNEILDELKNRFPELFE